MRFYRGCNQKEEVEEDKHDLNVVEGNMGILGGLDKEDDKIIDLNFQLHNFYIHSLLSSTNTIWNQH